MENFLPPWISLFDETKSFYKCPRLQETILLKMSLLNLFSYFLSLSFKNRVLLLLVLLILLLTHLEWISLKMLLTRASFFLSQGQLQKLSIFYEVAPNKTNSIPESGTTLEISCLENSPYKISEEQCYQISTMASPWQKPIAVLWPTTTTRRWRNGCSVAVHGGRILHSSWRWQNGNGRRNRGRNERWLLHWEKYQQSGRRKGQHNFSNLICFLCLTQLKIGLGPIKI